MIPSDLLREVSAIPLAYFSLGSAPPENIHSIGTFLHLAPASQNQQFGTTLVGSSLCGCQVVAEDRTKINEARYESAKEAADWLRIRKTT